GGNVNLSHIVSFSTRDDDFDTDNGWSGKAQYGLLVRVDSVSDEGDRGNVFESDNDAAGTFNKPYTSGVISNFTCVGPAQTPTSTIAPTYGWGARIRRNSAQSIFNSIFIGFDVGVEFNGSGTQGKFNNDTIEFKNNIVGGSKKRNGQAVFDSLVLNNPNFFNTTYSGNANSGVQLVAPFNFPNFDFRPQPGSPALSGFSYSSPKLAGLEQPSYRGAFGTGPYDNWWRCWGEFNPQTQDYTNGPINYSYVASIDVNGPTLVCPAGGGNPTQLVVNSNISGLSYNWSTGATSQSITVNAPGTYTVTVSSPRGCTRVISRTINAYPTTAPSITPVNPSFCTGQSVTLSSTVANGYLWSNGATTQQITVTSGGSYSVTITDANGCQVASNTVNVVQNNPVVPTITALGSTSFCTGGSVKIAVNNPSDFISFAWSNNQSLDTIIVTTTGSYRVTTTDQNGCTAVSNTINTDVSSAPKPTISASGPETFCAGDSVILTSSEADSYSWSTGETTRSIVVRASGSYTVVVTNADQCKGVGSSNPKVITVQPKPVANFTVSQQGNVVTVTNTSTGATSFNWTFGNGQSSTQQNPSAVTYNQNGTFTITLTATNGNCSDVVSKQVVITGVSVEDIELPSISSVKLYPNPNKGFVTLEVSSTANEGAQIAVIDLTGRTVLSLQRELTTGINQIPVLTDELSNGVYMVEVKVANAVRLARMIVNKD
ncbi:MAG: T9SS type A sorting domain-containing protein, partial [Chitinophagales bacterium]|nr:T9SS type A sorting domain-containing protein [Chitinophagales bacterium]